MRRTLALVSCCLLGGAVRPVASQMFMTDARRIGMGGLSLTIDGRLSRYNPAYGAVPASAAPGGAKATIPLPLGLIQFFHDHPISTLSKDPLFNPDSATFNPVAALDLFLNPPIFYQLTKPPEPTNNVAFGVGRDSFQVNLGASQALVPSGQFGINGSSRPFSIEPSFGGFKAGVMVWLDDQVDLQLGDSLLALLKEAHPAAHNTQYDVTANGVLQGGFAPTVGYAGRVYGNDQRGFYVGGAVHYYFGLAYGSTTDQGGFTTGNNAIFGGSNPLTPNFTGQTSYSKWGNSMGHGVGGDVGVAWISGPIVVGLGVNDVGATITWPNSRVDFVHYDSTQSKFVTDSSHLNVQTTSKLPVSYLANVIYTLGGTTVGADVFDQGQGAELHLGAEQRLGMFAVRGGIERDEQKILQFAWGGGIRLGAFSFDLGFWTQSYSLSGQRSLTMATSISIY